MKRTTIKVPIFDVSINVILSENFNETISWLSDVHSIELQCPEWYAAFTQEINGEIFLVYKTPCNIQTVLHEIVHAVFAINRIIGLEYNEETFCYLIDWLYPQIYKFIFDD